MTPHNYDVLKSDQEFRDFIHTLQDIYTIFQDFGNVKSREHITVILSEIEAELLAL